MRKFAKFRIVSQNVLKKFSHSHRFAKFFQEIFAFASLRIFLFNAKAHPWRRSVVTKSSDHNSQGGWFSHDDQRPADEEANKTAVGIIAVTVLRAGRVD